MIVYLLKFIACSAILLLLFHVFLAKEKTFQLNRWVLLSLIPAAMVIPFMSFPVFVPEETQAQVTYLQLAHEQQVSIIPMTTPAHSPLSWFLLIYLSVFFLLLFIKLKALNRLITWTKLSPARAIQGAFLIISEKVLSPFSFWKFIFMSPSIYKEGNENTELILKHERVHISQMHYIDLALMEVLSVICWFNPIVYLVKKSVILNHEYLADQKVQHTIHPIKYKKLLLELTVGTNHAAWTSSMASSTLKNRLIMMNKSTTKNTMHLRVFGFTLFTTLIVAGFSIKINAQQPAPVPSSSPKHVQWDQSYPIVEQPEYKGGMAAFYRYVEDELQYPLEARQKGIEGQVEVQFVVEKDGTLSNVSIIRGIGAGCDEEAERVVKNSPSFHPGKQRGSPVKVQMVLPLLFSLTEPDGDKLPAGTFSVGEVEQRNGTLKVDADYADGYWSGTVKDPQGNVLPGATILVEGTERGSVTDIDGDFIIQTSPSEPIVIIFVGYKSVKLVGK